MRAFATGWRRGRTSRAEPECSSGKGVVASSPFPNSSRGCFVLRGFALRDNAASGRVPTESFGWLHALVELRRSVYSGADHPEQSMLAARRDECSASCPGQEAQADELGRICERAEGATPSEREGGARDCGARAAPLRLAWACVLVVGSRAQHLRLWHGAETNDREPMLVASARFLQPLAACGIRLAAVSGRLSLVVVATRPVVAGATELSWTLVQGSRWLQLSSCSAELGALRSGCDVIGGVLQWPPPPHSERSQSVTVAQLRTSPPFANPR